MSFDPYSSPMRDEGQDDYPHLGDKQIAAITAKATSGEECGRAGPGTQGLDLQTIGFSTSPKSLPLSRFRGEMRKPGLVSSGKRWDQGPGNWPRVVVEQGKRALCPSASQPH